MNTTDSHPRVLSLSSTSPVTSPMSTTTSTPFATTPATPQEQSRRPSISSPENIHFSASQEKTHRTLNGSIKKMWRDIKHHAAEHHRSVNAAYQAQYGAGARTPILEGYGVPGVEERRRGAEGRMGSVV